jgi:hypothetical protein
MRLQYALDHASIADRALWREQIAIIVARYPRWARELLAGLDPLERRAVEDIATIRRLLAPADASASGPLQSLLRIAPVEGGGFVAYLGRADGVYVAPITTDYALGPAEPYAPWSIWKGEQTCE